MRRGLASLIIGLSLIVASLSWAGFTLSRTILDPGRSERLADQLLENPDVRAALTSRLADALEAQIPAEVPVPRSTIESGAATALDDPRVEALIRDGFVRVHQNALEGNAEPVVVDANALGAAGRDMLVQVRPELDPFLPASPSVEVELPTTGLAWLGTVKNVVDRFTTLAALVALLGAVSAFLIARDRGPVLRRVAFWGYGAAAFWLLVGYGVPWLAGNLSPTSAAIATAAADVFFGAMIQPAVIMAIVATALLIAGLTLPMFERRRGARAVQPRRRTAEPAAAAPAATVPATARRSAAGGVIDRTAVQPIPTRPATAGQQQAPVGSAPIHQNEPAHRPATQAMPTARFNPQPTAAQPTAAPTGSSTTGSPAHVASQTTRRMPPDTAGGVVQPGSHATATPNPGTGQPPEERRSVLWENDKPKDPTDPMPIPTWADGK